MLWTFAVMPEMPRFFFYLAFHLSYFIIGFNNELFLVVGFSPDVGVFIPVISLKSFFGAKSFSWAWFSFGFRFWCYFLILGPVCEVLFFVTNHGAIWRKFRPRWLFTHLHSIYKPSFPRLHDRGVLLLLGTFIHNMIVFAGRSGHILNDLTNLIWCDIIETFNWFKSTLLIHFLTIHYSFQRNWFLFHKLLSWSFFATLGGILQPGCCRTDEIFTVELACYLILEEEVLFLILLLLFLIDVVFEFLVCFSSRSFIDWRSWNRLRVHHFGDHCLIFEVFAIQEGVGIQLHFRLGISVSGARVLYMIWIIGCCLQNRPGVSNAFFHVIWSYWVYIDFVVLPVGCSFDAGNWLQMDFVHLDLVVEQVYLRSDLWLFGWCWQELLGVSHAEVAGVVHLRVCTGFYGGCWCWSGVVCFPVDLYLYGRNFA